MDARHHFNSHHRPQPTAPPQTMTPTSTASAATKLSLAAQFDDMCRFSNSLTQYGALENQFIALLHSHEAWRQKFMSKEMDMERLIEENEALKSDKMILDTKLKNVRHSLMKQVNITESATKERDALRLTLAKVTHIVMEEEKPNGPETATRINSREKLMSCLNFPRLETLAEAESREDTQDESSIEGIEYDRTEDDILGFSQSASVRERRKSSNARKSTASRGSPSKANASKRSRRGEDEVNGVATDNLDVEMVEEARDVMDVTDINCDKRRSVETVKSLFPLGRLQRENGFTPKPLFKSTAELRRESGATLRRNSGASLMSQPEVVRMMQQIQDKRLENRKHDFFMKKIFKPGEKCGPCGGAIRFCTNCYKCKDCNATAHLDCKDKVPLPCIPIAQNQHKNGRLQLIADYVNSTDNPKIPALIYHVCTEIERRGLDEVGLYRVNGADKEIKELKDKILKSKTGMPSLQNFDVLTLCGVVKEFLRSLDEPLIPRLMWSDFVKAAEASDPEDKKIWLYQAVSELPDANRDTLAFLVLHLQKIADSPHCKMGKSNLAKILGPTVVGTKNTNYNTPNVMVEIQKQLSIMSLLLETTGDYWSGVLNPASTNDEVATDFKTPESPDRRTSIGRTIGGTVTQFGLLTPAKGPADFGTRKPMMLKPLF